MVDKKLPYIKIPPQNLDSERALLGSIMLRGDALYEIIDLIEPDSFYAEKHRIIYRAMLELAAKNEPIDMVTLSGKLKEKKELEQVGGVSYLSELVNSVPSSSNISYYANIVHEKSLLRRLIEAADYISELGFSENKEIEYILNEAEKCIFDITTSPKTGKFTTLKETIGEVWERIDRLHKSTSELRGVPTGFRELDNKLAGLHKSDLIILAARPSMGKTALALDIARQAAIQASIPVLIFSLEMSAQQLVDRMLAAEARIDSWKLRLSKLSTDDEFTRLRDAMDRLSRAPIFIDDQAANSIMKMRSIARRIKSQHGLGLIVVDYLQLMAPSRHYDSMVHQVTEISRALKSLARELETPVLAISQLSRAVEARGGKPRLSDLRDSGSIEQDADVVMFIHRDDRINESSEKPNIAEILIEKHRNGPTGRLELYFDDQKTTFLTIEKGEYDKFDTEEF